MLNNTYLTILFNILKMLNNSIIGCSLVVVIKSSQKGYEVEEKMVQIKKVKIGDLQTQSRNDFTSLIFGRDRFSISLGGDETRLGYVRYVSVI